MFFSVGCLLLVEAFTIIPTVEPTMKSYSLPLPNRNGKAIVLICVIPVRNGKRMDADTEHKLMIE